MALALSFGRFYGLDSFVELAIIIVSIIIFYYSRKIYKLFGEKNYNLFAISFFLIAVSFIFKILSNLTILHRVEIHDLNFVFTVFSQPEYIKLVNFFSLIFFKIFNLSGFLLLFFIFTNKNNEKTWLFVYLGIIAVLFSIYFNFIFFLTLVVILIYLTLYFHENYKKTGGSNAFFVFLSFLIILASNLFFIFSDVHSLFYLIGEILILVGFLFLLINQVKLKQNAVMTHETKKNKARDRKRYLRHTSKK